VRNRQHGERWRSNFETGAELNEGKIGRESLFRRSSSSQRRSSFSLPPPFPPFSFHGRSPTQPHSIGQRCGAAQATRPACSFDLRRQRPREAWMSDAAVFRPSFPSFLPWREMDGLNAQTRRRQRLRSRSKARDSWTRNSPPLFPLTKLEEVEKRSLNTEPGPPRTLPGASFAAAILTAPPYFLLFLLLSSEPQY